MFDEKTLFSYLINLKRPSFPYLISVNGNYVAPFFAFCTFSVIVSKPSPVHKKLVISLLKPTLNRIRNFIKSKDSARYCLKFNSVAAEGRRIRVVRTIPISGIEATRDKRGNGSVSLRDDALASLMVIINGWLSRDLQTPGRTLPPDNANENVY